MILVMCRLGSSKSLPEASSLVYNTPAGFQNGGIFLYLGPPSTLNCHENGTF